jgi:hypothetical protein
VAWVILDFDAFANLEEACDRLVIDLVDSANDTLKDRPELFTRKLGLNYRVAEGERSQDFSASNGTLIDGRTDATGIYKSEDGVATAI